MFYVVSCPLCLLSTAMHSLYVTCRANAGLYQPISGHAAVADRRNAISRYRDIIVGFATISRPNKFPWFEPYCWACIYCDVLDMWKQCFFVRYEPVRRTGKSDDWITFFARIIRLTVQKFQLFWVIFCVIIFLWLAKMT